SDTVSFVIRISGDLYALHLFGETYGLGIGLGGVRSSSLLATMLASVGVVGTGAFLWFIVTLLHAASTGFRWYLAGVLFAMCTGEPDMNLSILWASILVGIVEYTSPDPSGHMSGPQKLKITSRIAAGISKWKFH